MNAGDHYPAAWTAPPSGFVCKFVEALEHRVVDAFAFVKFLLACCASLSSAVRASCSIFRDVLDLDEMRASDAVSAVFGQGVPLDRAVCVNLHDVCWDEV